MEPTLFEGDVVFVDTNAFAGAMPAEFDVVVALHPQQPGLEIIKRVEFVDENGAYLRSDNTETIDASDSRRFGLVPADRLIGTVIAKVARS